MQAIDPIRTKYYIRDRASQAATINFPPAHTQHGSSTGSAPTYLLPVPFFFFESMYNCTLLNYKCFSNYELPAYINRVQLEVLQVHYRKVWAAGKFPTGNYVINFPKLGR